MRAVVMLVPWKMEDDGCVVASFGVHAAMRYPARR